MSFPTAASPWLGSPDGTISIANGQITSAGNFSTALANAAAAIVAPAITPEFPVGAISPALETATLPELVEIVWEEGTAPDAFDGTLEGPEFPEFSGVAPVLVTGTAPTADLGVIPTLPPIETIGSVGTVSVALPEVPALLSLTVSAFNGVAIPTFDGGDLPTVSLVEPSVTAYEPGEQYTSALLGTLASSLASRIASGGTGLSASVEQAIWDRARERELRAVQDAIDGLERMEAMGFSLPTGVYLDSRIKIQTEYGKTQAGLSRDIAIKQAELELSNVQEALRTATQLESQLLDYTSKLEQRVFESARYATEAGVQIYTAKVEAYRALLDAYKTKVQIYEAQIRGELAKVEAYRAQIAAEQAKAEINSALVQQFKVRADVAMSTVEVFKAQIQGLLAKAQIEQVKVQAYGEQIRAYGAKANAFTAEVEGYKAQMQAEATKQEAYRSSVQAFASQVDAAAKASDAKIAVYRGQIEAYTAQWDGYKAQAQAQASKAAAIASGNQSLSEAYRAQVTGVASYNDTLTKQWQVALDQAQRVSEISIAASKANGEFYISTRSLIMEASKVGAQVAAQLGASALNALNWSNSFSASDSFSISTSTSNNTNTNTNL